MGRPPGAPAGYDPGHDAPYREGGDGWGGRAGLDTQPVEAYQPDTYAPDSYPGAHRFDSPRPGFHGDVGVLDDEYAYTEAVPQPQPGALARQARRSDARPGAGRASRPSARPELPYVAAFDGLRAIALLAVLAFHQGFDAARGGFLGISSFFTLSGFLVATFALAEWAQNGRLAVGRLWERRGRRILPALLVTAGVVVALQAALRVGAGPGFRGDVLAAVAQVLNWRFAFEGDGFASVLTDPSPVQHLWSLSMLVQISVLFPLVFVAVMRVTGRRWRAAGALFAAAAIASFAAASLTASRSGNDGLAYFGTHTRVGELLVGVVLAYAVLSPGARRVVGSPTGGRVVRGGAIGALVVLAWLWHSTGLYSANLFGGVTAVNAVLTAWVIFAVTVPGPVATALGSSPLRLLGKVSYAAYLVHWPLFLLLDDDRLGLDGPLLFLVRLGATLGAAAAITLLIERPFRAGGQIRTRPAQLAVGLIVCAALVAGAAVVLPEQPPAGVSLSIDDGNGAGDLDAVVPSGAGGDGETLSIALVGGTLAGSLQPGFEAWNAEQTDEQVRVHTHVASDCPLSAPGPVRLAGRTVGEDTECLGFAPRLPRLLDRAEPDVVVVVPSVADLGTREIDRQRVHLGDPVFDGWMRDHLRDLADTLDDAGVPVIWATAPHVRVAPAGQGGEAGEAAPDWTTVADNDPARVDRLNEIIRDVVADRDGNSVVDVGAWMQRLPRGEFAAAYRAEGGDLTEDGATRAVAWLVPELRSLLE
jgi:peptidoglycan/LPS O-acetylase OafA/YrhL